MVQRLNIIYPRLEVQGIYIETHVLQIVLITFFSVVGLIICQCFKVQILHFRITLFFDWEKACAPWPRQSIKVQYLKVHRLHLKNQV